MSRSAAQQVEHWARVGAALEAVGLSVAEVADLLRSGKAGRSAGEIEQDAWTFKRALQTQDIKNAQAGRLSGARLSWFSGGKAKAARLLNSPY